MHFADRGSNQTATAGILPPPNKYAHITRETRRNKVNHGFKANVGLFVYSLFMALSDVTACDLPKDFAFLLTYDE